MRRNTIIDKIIIGIASIVLTCGVVYICTADNKNIMANNVIDVRSNENQKIVIGSKVNELTKELIMLKQDFSRDSEISVDINEQSSYVQFYISGINNSNDLQHGITRLIGNNEFKALEEYTGKSIGEDIAIFFNEESENDRILKVYSECNTTIDMQKYRDAEGGYTGNIEITVYDYEIKDSYYKDIDKIIRGDGYSLVAMNQANKGCEMIYQDIGVTRWEEEVCIIDDQEINAATVDLRIVTKNNEISEVSLLGESKAKTKDEIIITKYQLEMISRLVAALGIPQAENNIRELLFNSNTTNNMSELIEGDGYEIKSFEVVRERGDSNQYYTRLDIIVN